MQCLAFTTTLSEQIAHSTVYTHLKEISEYLHGSVMNTNFTCFTAFVCSFELPTLTLGRRETKGIHGAFLLRLSVEGKMSAVKA